ncbi:MAG TPA: hypothetical protein VF559_04370 [Caulobacteraceae bacterium]
MNPGVAICIAAAAALLMLGGCDAPQLKPRPAAVAEPPPQPCETVDRRVAPGETARVCVLIGRASLVRLQRGGAGTATVCNRSDVQRVWIAWSPAEPGGEGLQATQAVWNADPARRRTLAAGQCARVGPAAAVTLRGYFDGRQGYDIGSDWEGTVTFAATPPSS